MMLAKVGTEKRIMLFGIKHDQTEANFKGDWLGPIEVILIASDLTVSKSLTQVLAFFPHFYIPPSSSHSLCVCKDQSFRKQRIGGYYSYNAHTEDDFIATPKGPQAIADAISIKVPHGNQSPEQQSGSGRSKSTRTGHIREQVPDKHRVSVSPCLTKMWSKIPH